MVSKLLIISLSIKWEYDVRVERETEDPTPDS
jgi:hypothetical protein